jgi:hypothetical protein
MFATLSFGDLMTVLTLFGVIAGFAMLIADRWVRR